MTLKPILACALGLLLLAGCSKKEPEPDKTARAPASYVNKVWQVSESKTIQPGQLYVFLSEGTLVIASSTGKPAFGSWKASGSNLVMTEASLPYQVDVLELTAEKMKIRILSPGEPVEMTLVPAAH